MADKKEIVINVLNEKITSMNVTDKEEWIAFKNKLQEKGRIDILDELKREPSHKFDITAIIVNYEKKMLTYSFLFKSCLMIVISFAIILKITYFIFEFENEVSFIYYFLLITILAGNLIMMKMIKTNKEECFFFLEAYKYKLLFPYFDYESECEELINTAILDNKEDIRESVNISIGLGEYSDNFVGFNIIFDESYFSTKVKDVKNIFIVFEVSNVCRKTGELYGSKWVHSSKIYEFLNKNYNDRSVFMIKNAINKYLNNNRHNMFNAMSEK